MGDEEREAKYLLNRLVFINYLLVAQGMERKGVSGKKPIQKPKYPGNK